MQPSSTSLFVRRLALLPLVLLAAAVVLSYLAPPQYIGWSLFFLQLQFNSWDPCFFRNKVASSYFLAHHASHFGPSPPLVSPSPVLELSALDYSYDNLRLASKEWTEPVVVRGMFKDSRALHWSSDLFGPGSPLSALSDFNVSVVQNSTLGKDHDFNCGLTFPGVPDTVMTKFSSAAKEIKTYDPTSTKPSKTLILPPASRTHREVDRSLDSAFASIVERDIDLRRFGGDWEKKGGRNAVVTQLWMGSGQEVGRDRDMGTGWHMDICNSYKIQLAGSKKWTFIHGKYASLMRPTMKAGKTAAVGTDLSVRYDVEPYLPRQELVLHAGDFLYNPDFYYHNVKNEPGFTMAVAARECKPSRYFRASPLVASTIVLNHVRAAIFQGDGYALERLKGALFNVVDSNK